MGNKYFDSGHKKSKQTKDREGLRGGKITMNSRSEWPSDAYQPSSANEPKV